MTCTPEQPFGIWAVVDPDGDPAVTINAARHVGDGVVALVTGPRPVAELAAALGVTEVRWLGEPAGSTSFEDYSEVVADIARQAGTGMVVAPATPRGRLLAGRVAARLGTSVLTDIASARVADNSVVVTRPFYGGAAFREEKPLTPLAVVTVSRLFAPPGSPSPAPAPITAVDASPDEVGRLIERRQAAARSGTLTSAKVVVGAGRGVGHQEDLGLLQHLADSLGGELACTRPLAEGLGWMGRDRYIGISGLTLSPDLYIAVGISGQMQHMVGVSDAKTIVAINSDPSAPVFEQADFGIVGDFHEVVPALIKALEQGP